MNTDYAWWQNALNGQFGPIHDGQPECGFYRKRDRKGGEYLPVAIWKDDNANWLAKVGERMVDATEIWTWVCKNPVTHAAYLSAVDGEGWPDRDAAIDVPPPPMGDNHPPEEDSLEALREQIDNAKAGAAKYEKIDDDETASTALSLRNRLNELANKADKIRKTLKEPHLQAGKEIDSAWIPLVKDAKSVADAIREALSAHETRKYQAEQKRRREQEEARLKALAEFDAARRAAEAEGKSISDPKPVSETPTEQAPVAPSQIASGYGRAAAVKLVKVARVVDQDRAYLAMRTHPELVELIAKLAQRAINAGHTIEGVEVSEERKVA